MPCEKTSGKSRLLGEVDIDMHRIVIAGCAAIERERVAADRRKGLVTRRSPTAEFRRMPVHHDDLLVAHDDGADRVRDVLAVLVGDLVVDVDQVIAPPFLSTTSVTRDWNVSVSPTTTGA